MKSDPLLKKNIHRVLNIYIILFTVFSFTLFSMLAKGFSLITDTNSLFSLSVLHLKQKKLWVIFSYGIYHSNWGYFIVCLIPILFMTSKLSKWYSQYELGKFYVFSYLAGAISHILLAPQSHAIQGASGQLLAFLLMYSRFYGKKHIVRILRFNVNVSLFIIFLVIVNFLTIGLQFRMNGSSFGSHIGIVIFFIIYVYLDRERKKDVYRFEDSYAYKDKFQKPKKEPINKFATKKKNPSEFEIDRILDKISENGIHSLTEEEKAILKNASKGNK